MTAGNGKAPGPCKCESWVTGGLRINFERDPADDRITDVQISTPPRRTAVHEKFVDRMNKHLPGMAEWQGERLVIRSTRTELAFKKAGYCEPCRYVLLEYAGAS